MVGRTARPEHPGRAVLLPILVALLCAGLGLPVSLAAQSAVLAGRVVDGETGEPIAGGVVRILGVATGQVSEGRTDSGGSFRLSVRPGRHILVVVAQGYGVVRLDGVRAPNDDAPRVVVLTPSATLFDPFITAPDRSRVERVSSAPSSAAVVDSMAARASGGFTVADLADGLPGVAAAWTGILGRSMGVRGFNGVFAGGPVLLEDGRLAQMPSSRLNAFELVPSTFLDVERVELLRGPVSALYGPNTVGGALRVVTTSPIDHPGTSVSFSTGERGVYHGAVREAFRLSDRSGLRVSGQYMRGREWISPGPADSIAVPPHAESAGGQVRLDVRPWDDGEVVFSAGVGRMSNSRLLLREGPALVTGWTQRFAQARMRKGRVSAQAFANRGDAGSSIVLATGDALVDASTVLGGRVQYGRRVDPLLDVTVGFDATRTLPGTGGTVHGSMEDADGVTEAGGYVYGVSQPTDRVEVSGAVRVDGHNRLTGFQVSPSLSVVFEAAPGQKLRAAINRGYTNPTPDLLFADRVTSRIPLLDTPGFDVRVLGLPEGGLTFDRRCPGGFDDRCMFSPLQPGIRMPATGAALWDAVLVPLALQSETLRANLAGMGISPNGFAQIIGRPGPSDMTSRLERWNDGAGAVFAPASPPQAVAGLRPAITETVEVGFRGGSPGRIAFSVEVYATRVSGLVGPLEVATPTLYLDPASVEAFLMRRMSAVGIPAGVADRIAAGIAATTAGVPLGTLAPDQRDGPDVVLAYRNLGDVRFVGADVGGRWGVTPRITLFGALNYLGRNCFDFDADGVCRSAGDVTANAPRLSGSATVRWSDVMQGVTLGGRLRHAGGFPMVAGVYRGDVAAHTLLDVDGRFILPWAPGTTVGVSVTNVLDAPHRDLVGTPEIGRLALVTLRYAF